MNNISPNVSICNSCTIKKFIFYFLYLGTCCFGGPLALVSYMQRDLVEKYKWISKEDYIDGLALAQMAPGPLATQLAIYLGYIKYGLTGATLVPIALIVPSFLLVLGISYLYVHFGGLSFVQALFYGIGAAVVGIIIKAAYKLIGLTLEKDICLWIIFFVLAISTFVTQKEIAILFFLSGIAYMMIKTNLTKSTINLSIIPGLPLLALNTSGIIQNIFQTTLFKIFLFFCKSGLVIFGSGLAIVPFLYGGVVKDYHWLNDKQFMDAVAIAMITPGPVVITVAFIGYLVKGLPGATLATLGVFLPVYLFVVIPSPFFKKYAKNPYLNSFIKGITAGATGALAGACILLTKQAITDTPTLIIAISSLFLLFKFKNIPEPLIVLISGIVGLLCF